MIPVSSESLTNSQNSQVSQVLPSKTYRIDPVNKRILGTIDGKEAVMQFIQKVLVTDKYAYEIYDWYYGSELYKLVGKSYDYAVTRIVNLFREALLVDDRIIDVRNFTVYQTSIDAMVVSCYIDTVYGQIPYEQEVKI